jgi:hypothetical protein
MTIPWQTGDEWRIPNELDKVFDRAFKNALRGSPATVVCRSPWCRLDLDHMASVFRTGPFIGVNLSILSFPSTYCVSGGDPFFWRHVRPSEHPRTSFVLPASQRNIDYANANNWSNVTLYSAPPELPPGMQRHQRNLPRPWKCDNSGNVAVWLAWYMGADPIYIAGAHFKLCDQVIHGDSPELDEPGDELRRHYQGSFERDRRDLTGLVAAMRSDQVIVHWPGEKTDA